MLHSFASTGYLPPGVHDCSLESLAAIVCFNEHRRKLWAQLANFLLWPSFSNDFAYAYIGGGYVSIKPIPRDVDLVLETELPYGPESFSAIAPFFVTGLDQIEDLFGVHLHFWMENAPTGFRDFRTFFQYQRPRSLQNFDPARGIVRLDLRDPRILSDLRRYVKNESIDSGCKF